MLLKNQGRLDGVNTVSDGLNVREKNNAKPSKHSKREPRAKQGFGWGKFGELHKTIFDRSSSPNCAYN